jgi:hypothetical protein
MTRKTLHPKGDFDKNQRLLEIINLENILLGYLRFQKTTLEQAGKL